MGLHQDSETKKRAKRRVPLYALLVSCLAALFLGMLLTAGVVVQMLGRDGLSVLQATVTIRQRFVGEHDMHESANGAISNMIGSLGDRWSYFLDAESYARVVQNRANAYTGIGVTISPEPLDALAILKVTEDSPAARAGLVAGDRIVVVDGVTVTAENRAACVEAVGGEEGSSVTLSVAAADGAIRTLEIRREKITTLPVMHELLDGAVGYVKIRNFYDGSGAAMQAAVDSLLEQGATSFLFDLRDNPGGYVTEMTKMLDHLLPEGVIFQSSNVRGVQESYTSDAKMVDAPFAVLLNEDSYSAAEFFGAQLRESTSAYIVGALTSGKGYAQQIFTLLNGSAIGISTSSYCTGAGSSLIGVGVTPDESVALTQEQRQLLQGEELAKADDAQLQAAVKKLRSEN